MEKWEFKKITLKQMMDYIDANCPNDKEWFKSVAINPDTGRYQHLVAVRAFCDKYMPDIIPVAKAKEPKKSSALLDW